MEELFEAFVLTILVMTVIIILGGISAYLYDYYHQPSPDHDSLAGKALAKRRTRTKIVASEILRDKTRSKASMTAAGRALGQRRK